MAITTIVPADSKVSFGNEKAMGVDMSGVNPNIHALWFDTEKNEGYIEFIQDPETGEYPPLEPITSLASWQTQIDEAKEIIYCEANPKTCYKTSEPVGKAILVRSKGWPTPEGYTDEVPPEKDSELSDLYWDGSAFVWSVFPISLTLSESKDYLSSMVNDKAYTLLQPSDWMAVREMETGIPMSQDWKDWRDSIRVEASNKRETVNGKKSLKELSSYSKSTEFSSWPPSP